MNMRTALLVGTVAALMSLADTASAAAATMPKDANTTCPVMTQEEAAPDLYVDYKDTRVYVCCTKCKRKFRENPELYMKRLKTDDKTSSATAENKKVAPAVK